MAKRKTKRKTKRTENTIEMTKTSYDELVKELEERKTTSREEIAEEISAARELGDLSENHAYTVAMEKKDMNENRISDLDELIKNVHVVTKKGSSNLATIGTTVEIEDTATKKTRKITLVGSEETEAADPLSGKLSIDSPIGKAIYNSKVGDFVVVNLPMKEVEYKLKKIM